LPHDRIQAVKADLSEPLPLVAPKEFVRIAASIATDPVDAASPPRKAAARRALHATASPEALSRLKAAAALSDGKSEEGRSLRRSVAFIEEMGTRIAGAPAALRSLRKAVGVLPGGSEAPLLDALFDGIANKGLPDVANHGSLPLASGSALDA